MKHTITGSDVFLKEDLRAILDALDIAARHQPIGQFRTGWLAAATAMRAALPMLDDWHAADEPQIMEVRR